MDHSDYSNCASGGSRKAQRPGGSWLPATLIYCATSLAALLVGWCTSSAPASRSSPSLPPQPAAAPAPAASHPVPPINALPGSGAHSGLAARVLPAVSAAAGAGARLAWRTLSAATESPGLTSGVQGWHRGPAGAVGLPLALLALSLAAAWALWQRLRAVAASSAQKQVDRLLTLADALTHQCASKDATIRQQQAVNAAQLQQLSALQSELRAMQVQLDAARAEGEVAQSAAACSDAELQAAREALEAAKTAAAASQLSLSVLQSEFSATQDQLATVQAEAEAARSTAAVLNTQLQSAREALQSAKDALRTTKQQAAAPEASAPRLSALQSELRAVRGQLATAQADWESAQRGVTRLKAELQAAQEKLKAERPPAILVLPAAMRVMLNNPVYVALIASRDVLGLAAALWGGDVTTTQGLPCIAATGCISPCEKPRDSIEAASWSKAVALSLVLLQHMTPAAEDALVAARDAVSALGAGAWESSHRAVTLAYSDKLQALDSTLFGRFHGVVPATPANSRELHIYVKAAALMIVSRVTRA